MDLALQGSLLDLGDPMTLGDLPGSLRRVELGAGAWVDVRPGWLVAGDELFATLVRDVPWRAERRKMYDNVVDVPRLTKFYAGGERLPHPILDSAREALSAHYGEELGEPFVTAGMCLYRDGRDSVAWHGDRIGRSKDLDTDRRDPVARVVADAGAPPARWRPHSRLHAEVLALSARAW